MSIGGAHPTRAISPYAPNQTPPKQSARRARHTTLPAAYSGASRSGSPSPQPQHGGNGASSSGSSNGANSGMSSNASPAAASAVAGGLLSAPAAAAADAAGSMLLASARVLVPQLPSLSALWPGGGGHQQQQRRQQEQQQQQQRQQQQQQVSIDSSGNDERAAPVMMAPTATAAAGEAPLPGGNVDSAALQGPLAGAIARAHALAAAGRASSEAEWQALEAESLPVLPLGPDAGAVVALLEAVARNSDRRPAAAWLAAAQQALVAASAANAAGLSGETWGAALAALARLGPVDRATAQAALADTTSQLGTLPPPALARLLAGAAKARLMPSAAWLAALRPALAAAAPALAAPQLAAALKALALLADRVEEDELRGPAAALAAELAARPRGAAPGELAQALWALARLGVRPARRDGAEAAAAAGASPSASMDAEAGVGADDGVEGAARVAEALLAPICEQLPRLAPSHLSW